MPKKLFISKYNGDFFTYFQILGNLYQSFVAVLVKSLSEKFRKIQRKTLVPKTLFDKTTNCRLLNPMIPHDCFYPLDYTKPYQNITKIMSFYHIFIVALMPL